ncbi:hypothetical protein BJP36_36945 [Moorena producens JHB]|uniref:Uncharacterized protein n=1 Tax=Moorena producens (strain JHB) TaxID=1454205 RepID=A0A9Q9SU35_MOOP1|nr:hypothetical protein [Moorena producens]WAN69684.1 hypothetical protein BJP36_36945 [Moorena producens JHB]
MGIGKSQEPRAKREQECPRLPTPNSQLPTPDSQLPTPNSQLPTPVPLLGGVRGGSRLPSKTLL